MSFDEIFDLSQLECIDVFFIIVLEKYVCDFQESVPTSKSPDYFPPTISSTPSPVPIPPPG